MTDRLIIPAPSETSNERSISWYEVTVDESPRTVTLAGFAPGKRKVTAARAEFRTATSGRGTSENRSRRIRIELGVALRADGSPWIFGTINDKVFSLSTPPVLPNLPAPNLTPLELEALIEWSRLGVPMNSLAQATRNSWGDTACTLHALGAGLHAGGCIAALAIETAIPKTIPKLAIPTAGVCGSAVANAASLYEHCLQGGTGSTTSGPASTPPHAPTVVEDPPSVVIVEQLPFVIELDPPAQVEPPQH